MTAHYIATLVEKCYNEIDLDLITKGWDTIPREEYGRKTDAWINTRIEDPAYLKWCKACNLLERYLKLNFETFEETELVYKWAKRVCEERNHAKNEWKAYGGYKSFSNFLSRNNRF
ncbi:hypothetical protein EBU94_06060 [bacterium]|nr:hypothetical protein [bacterium]